MCLLRRIATVAGLIRGKPITEHGVVVMRVEERVCPMGGHELDIGDGIGEPAVLGPTGKREDPARHRNVLGRPGRTPSSMSACQIYFDNVIGVIPKSVAICSRVTPAPRSRATRTTSSRNSLGKGFGTTTSFQPTLPGKPSQMSPHRAADPR